jgi:fatty-acyl-CoA synthase
MRGTMQRIPLSISTILRYGTSVYGTSYVATYTGDPERPFRRTSYAELGRRAARLAHGLRDRCGVTGDERVGTFMWNNTEHLEAYLAVPSMGAVLHTVNIRLSPAQLTYCVNHAEDRVLVVDSSLLRLLAPVLPQLKTVRYVVVTGHDADLTPLAESESITALGYEQLLDGMPDEFDWPEVDEDDAAALCYTSGTTGDPKGVAYSHRSIYLHSTQVCMRQGLGIADTDRIMPVVPMFHAMAWGLPYGALMTGGSLVMPDRFLQAAPVVDIVERERVTFTGAVPTVWNDVLAHLDTHGGDVSSLREVIIGGSAVPPAMLTGFEERHGVTVVHAWGMTELSPLGAVARPPAGSTGEERMRYRLSQGRLPAGVRGRLIGLDGEPAPHDGVAVGELEVRGPWVAGGYLHDDDPAKFHDGWLRTGDIGTLTPDGFFTITDRSKDVIKSGGEWISSVDLENQLMAHPAVGEATVVGVPDETWGERPLAVVVPRAGSDLDYSELRDFLLGHFAKWQVPERWATLPAVPKTSVGKFDKKEVRRAYAAGELPITLVDRSA